VAEVAKLFSEAGLIAIVSFISPYQEDRQTARKLLGAGRFVEVFVDCPLEECMKRDPHGLYHKSVRGEIANFTGVSDPYEVPAEAEITLKTATCSIDECVDKLFKYLFLNQLRQADCLDGVDRK